MKHSVPRLLSGWRDMSIGELVETHPELISQFAHVLITALDSTKDIGSTRIGREIMNRVPSCRHFEGALLVPGPLVGELHRDLDLFVGFDAIWCFDVMLDSAKPRDVSIAPPPSLDEEKPAPVVQEWMTHTGCRLALADGFGMNYVTPDPGLVAFLREC